MRDSSPAWQPVLPNVPVSVLISEFRTHGLNAQDEFVELYNNSDSPVIVATTDGSNGWALTSLSTNGTAVVRLTLPNGTVIPARGHYLGAMGASSGGYSLTGSAAPDAAISADLPDNTGLALFKTSNASNFTVINRLDAVGFNGPTGVTATLHREGEGLPPGPAADSATQHSFVRKVTAAGVPQDTNNNAADFVLVSTDGSNFGGTLSVLGAPGPESSTSPLRRNAQMPLTLIDPTQSPAAAPNRVRDLTPVANGTLSIRRRVTNSTGTNVTRLRFRIGAITTLNSPNTTGGVQADLRALSSGDVVVSLAGGGMTTARGTTLESPPQPDGGGLNSTLGAGFITMAAPLVPGASVDVQFRMSSSALR